MKKKIFFKYINSNSCLFFLINEISKQNFLALAKLCKSVSIHHFYTVYIVAVNQSFVLDNQFLNPQLKFNVKQQKAVIKTLTTTNLFVQQYLIQCANNNVYCTQINQNLKYVFNYIQLYYFINFNSFYMICYYIESLTLFKQ